MNSLKKKKRQCNRWENDNTSVTIWTCLVPGAREEGQLGPVRQSPTLHGVLSVSHRCHGFGTCSFQHMLPGSVRCHRTAVKQGGRQKQKESHRRAGELNVGFQRAQRRASAQSPWEWKRWSLGEGRCRNAWVHGVKCAQGGWASFLHPHTKNASTKILTIFCLILWITHSPTPLFIFFLNNSWTF